MAKLRATRIEKEKVEAEQQKILEEAKKKQEELALAARQASAQEMQRATSIDA